MILTLNQTGGIVTPCCKRPYPLCRCMDTPKTRASVAFSRAILNVFCKTGRGGGVDPTCGGAKARSRNPAYEGVKKYAQSMLDNPKGAKLGALAKQLSRLTVAQLNKLKGELGLRAGGRKAEVVAKLARQAVESVGFVEKAARQARVLGHGAEALRYFAHQTRRLHNDHADRINSLLRDARSLYRSNSGGKQLSRNNAAFNKGGDYTKLKGWDLVARGLAGNPKYSDLLHNAGYRGSGRAKEGEAYQTLFDFYKAGPVKRMTHREGYETSLAHLQNLPPTLSSRQGRDKSRKGKAAADDFDLF